MALLLSSTTRVKGREKTEKAHPFIGPVGTLRGRGKETCYFMVGILGHVDEEILDWEGGRREPSLGGHVTTDCIFLFPRVLAPQRKMTL